MKNFKKFIMVMFILILSSIVLNACENSSSLNNEEENLNITNVETTTETTVNTANVETTTEVTINTTNVETTTEVIINTTKYPEPEVIVISGANTNTIGVSDVISAIKNICENNNVYLRYIEYETDDSLFIEISCENDSNIANNIINEIYNSYTNTNYNNILSVDFSDINKEESESNRIILSADISPSGLNIY